MFCTCYNYSLARNAIVSMLSAFRCNIGSSGLQYKTTVCARAPHTHQRWKLWHMYQVHTYPTARARQRQRLQPRVASTRAARRQHQLRARAGVTRTCILCLGVCSLYVVRTRVTRCVLPSFLKRRVPFVPFCPFCLLLCKQIRRF